MRTMTTKRTDYSAMKPSTVEYESSEHATACGCEAMGEGD